MKDKFNKYCAEVIGAIDVNDYEEGIGGCPPLLSVTEQGVFISYTVEPYCWKGYNPYDDLNQMTEVVEKLLVNLPSHGVTLSAPINIKQAFRDFIISTMGDSE